MAIYRVLAESVQVYELELEANDAMHAMALAKGHDITAFNPWDDTDKTNSFEVLTAEALA